MRSKITPFPGGAAVDAESVEVQKSDERWNEYQLADGTVLRVRQIVTEVWRLEDQYDAEGNPQYVLKSAGILVVKSPDSLKRKVQ
jgi:hypothetical protein